jgi:hypothetical protein
MEEGKRSTGFQPTILQDKILQEALELGSYYNISQLFDRIKCPVQNWYRWHRECEGFTDWFANEFLKGMRQKIPELVSAGWKRAKKDHKYWQDLLKILEFMTEDKQTGDTYYNIQMSDTQKIERLNELRKRVLDARESAGDS